MSETAAVPADRRAADGTASRSSGPGAGRPGFCGWLCAVDHKTIGNRFIVTAFGFFVLAGLLAAAMRLQLARPENAVLGPDLYNQLFTMHGTTMMFLFAVPVMQAVGIYLVPLMVGTREHRVPAPERLRLLGVPVRRADPVSSAFALDIGPDAGWFAYVPLAGPEYSPGKRVDVWAQMITFTELAVARRGGAADHHDLQACARRACR